MRGLPDNNNLATALIMKILRYALLLTLAPFLATSAHAVSVHYDYDGAYNRTDEYTRAGDGTLLKHLKYHYDAAGRLTVIENVTDPAQTETLGYDDNGNQTSRTVGTSQTLYTFDARDQLVAVEKRADNAPPALLARYRYNADGMRVDGEEEGAARRYTWDEDELIQTQEPDATLSRYQWGPHRVASLLSTENGVLRRDWYFFDSLGSVTALVSDAGELSATYRFDAFGKIVAQTGESNNRFAFTGHQYDDVSGLYYFKARYYDPLQGRFISEDSYEGLITTPESRNGYIYANANPNVYIDDDGHVIGTIIGGITGSVWGASQMVGGLAYDTYNHVRFGEKMRSASEYGSVLAQNAIGGVEMGASFDVTVATGGTAAFVGSGALGTAGFGALSFDGKAKSWDKFGKDQVKDAAVGAAFGVGAKVVTPIASKLGSKALEKSALLQKAVATAGATAEQLATKVAKSGVAKDIRSLAAQAEAKLASLKERVSSFSKQPPATKPNIRVEAAENAVGPGSELIAKVDGSLSILPYKDMVRAPGRGQAHHLNQDAVFRDVIPHADGVSIKLEGNAFTEVGSPHYNAHRSLEKFYDQFRRGGSRAGEVPTNLEYSKALANSLRDAGLSHQHVREALQASIRQRSQAGQLGGVETPRLPGRLNQVKPEAELP